MNNKKRLKPKLSDKEKEERDKILKHISSKIRSGYTDEELEEERTNLCLSQGLSRWC